MGSNTNARSIYEGEDVPEGSPALPEALTGRPTNWEIAAAPTAAAPDPASGKKPDVLGHLSTTGVFHEENGPPPTNGVAGPSVACEDKAVDVLRIVTPNAPRRRSRADLTDVFAKIFSSGVPQPTKTVDAPMAVGADIVFVNGDPVGVTPSAIQGPTGQSRRHLVIQDVEEEEETPAPAPQADERWLSVSPPQSVEDGEDGTMSILDATKLWPPTMGWKDSESAKATVDALLGWPIGMSKNSDYVDFVFVVTPSCVDAMTSQKAIVSIQVLTVDSTAKAPHALEGKDFVLVQFTSSMGDDRSTSVLIDRRAAVAGVQWAGGPSIVSNLARQTMVSLKSYWHSVRAVPLEGLLTLEMAFAHPCWGHFTVDLIRKGRRVFSMQKGMERANLNACILAQAGMPWHEYKTFTGLDCAVEDAYSVMCAMLTSKRMERTTSTLILGPSGSGKSSFVRALRHKDVLDGDEFTKWGADHPELDDGYGLAKHVKVRDMRIAWVLATTNKTIIVNCEEAKVMRGWLELAGETLVFWPNEQDYERNCWGKDASEHQRNAHSRKDSVKRMLLGFKTPTLFGTTDMFEHVQRKHVVNTSQSARVLKLIGANKDTQGGPQEGGTVGAPPGEPVSPLPSPPGSPVMQSLMEEGESEMWDDPLGFELTGCQQERTSGQFDWETLFAEAQASFGKLGGLEKAVDEATQLTRHTVDQLEAERKERLAAETEAQTKMDACRRELKEALDFKELAQKEVGAVQASEAAAQKLLAEVHRNLELLKQETNTVGAELSRMGLVDPASRDNPTLWNAQMVEKFAKIKDQAKGPSEDMFRKCAALEAKKAQMLETESALRSQCARATKETQMAQGCLEEAQSKNQELSDELSKARVGVEVAQRDREAMCRLAAAWQQKITVAGNSQLHQTVSNQLPIRNVANIPPSTERGFTRPTVATLPRGVCPLLDSKQTLWMVNNIVIGLVLSIGEESIRASVDSEGNWVLSVCVGVTEAGTWAWNNEWAACLYALIMHTFLGLGGVYVWTWLLFTAHIFHNMAALAVQLMFLKEDTILYDPARFLLANPALARLFRASWEILKEKIRWGTTSTRPVTGDGAASGNPVTVARRFHSNRVGNGTYIRGRGSCNPTLLRYLANSGQRIVYELSKPKYKAGDATQPGIEPPGSRAHPMREPGEEQDASKKEAFHAREGFFENTVFKIGDGPGPATEVSYKMEPAFKPRLLSLLRHIADRVMSDANGQGYEGYLASLEDGRRLRKTSVADAAIEECAHHSQFNSTTDHREWSCFNTADDQLTSSMSSCFYRRTEEHYGIRCGVNHSWLPHFWSPAAMAWVFRSGRVSEPILEMMEQVGAELRRRLNAVLPTGGTVALTSADRRYLRQGKVSWQGYSTTVVLVPAGEDLKNLDLLDPSLIIVKVPLYENARSLAHWRGLVPQLCEAKHSFAIFNVDVCHLSFTARPLLDRYAESQDKFSVCTWAHLPVNLSCFFWKGGQTAGLAGNVYAFESLGFVYGSDEVVQLAFRDCVAVYDLPGNRIAMVGKSQETDIPVKVHAFVTDGHREIEYGFNRWDRGANSLLIWQEMAGLGIQPPPLDHLSILSSISKGTGSLEVVTAEEYDVKCYPPNPMMCDKNLTMQESAGVITLFCFGSEGDVRPVIYLGSVLASHGFWVVVVKLLTNEEGHAIVKAGEEHRSIDSVPAYIKAARRVSECRGIYYVPRNLASAGGIKYSCSPPSDVVRSLRAGVGKVVDFIKSMLDQTQPIDFWMSCYDRWKHVPRGLGENIKVERRRNLGVHAIGLRMGSSDARVPPEYRNVPLIPRGDDLEIFPLYKVVVCHGGAGTVQTAAACGCRVIVISPALDRNYRNRSDAGAEVKDMGDARRCLLTLVSHDLRFASVYIAAMSSGTASWLTKWYRVPLACWDVVAYKASAQTFVFLFNSAFLFASVWAMVSNHNNWGYSVDSTIVLLLVPHRIGITARWALSMTLELLLASFSEHIGMDWKTIIVGPFAKAIGTIHNKSLIPCLIQFGVFGFVVSSVIGRWSSALRVYGEVYGGMLMRAYYTEEPEEATHGVYIEFWWTRNFGLVFPIFHGRLIDKKRGLVYEGRHVLDAHLGAKFEATRSKYDDACERDPLRKAVLFPTRMTPERFDGLELRRAPYQPWWNCMIIIFESFVKDSLVDLGWKGAVAVVLASFYAAGLIAFAFFMMIIFWLVLMMVTWAFSLGAPEWANDVGLTASVKASMDPRAYNGAALWCQKVTMQGMSALAFFGVVEDVGENIAALDLAVSDEHLKTRMSDLGVEFDFRVGGSAWRTAGSTYNKMAVAAYESFNSIVDQEAVMRVVDETKGAFKRETYGSRAWLNYVKEKTDFLVTTAGGASAIAFSKWASRGAEVELESDDGELEQKISEFETEWPLHKRASMEYLQAVSGFMAAISETNVEATVDVIAQRVKPVPLKEILRRGISSKIRQEIVVLQAYRDRSQPDPTRTTDNKFRMAEKFRGQVTEVEVELLCRVGERGLSHKARKAFGETTEMVPPAEIAFDVALKRLAAMGSPSGLGVTVSQRAEVVAIVAQASADEKALLELLLYSADSGPMTAELESFLGGREIFAPGSTEEVRIILHHLGGLVQMAKQSHFDESNAYEAAMQTLLTYLEVEELAQDAEAQKRADILREIEARHRAGRPPTGGETIIQWWLRLEQYASRNQVLTDVLSVVATFVTKTEQLVLSYAVELVDALVGALMRLDFERQCEFVKPLIEFILDASDILAARLRVNPKVVWAPLYRRQRKPLSRAERLALEIRGPTNDAKGYKEDLEDTINLLQKHYTGEDEMPELLRTYVRAVYKPKLAYGTKREFEGVEGAPELIKDDVLDARVASYAARGVRQGLDGVWLSTPDANLKSLSRYEPDGYVSEPGLEALVIECADELYEQHSELFTNPKLSTPEVVMAYIEKKYSPGVPFIGRYSSRRAMFAAGWGKAIMDASKECLRTGFYPQVQSHAFPKMQVVDKEKLFKGKPVRTVVSQDLLTVFLDQILFLERSKRPASLEAGIATGRPLTEAGMRDFFQAVTAHKTFFKADEREYDSRTPPSIFAGLVRLAELGFNGNVNAVGKSDWVATRYVRLQKAYITELESGTVLRKNRGGSTGQALTSWDNTMGVKLKAMCAYCIATGRKPADFFKYNTFVNNSDDNMWGTSDERLNPHDLIEIYSHFFGGELDIESMNNINDLMFLGKVIEPGELHKADYEMLGTNTPAFAVKADVSNLLMRRSAFTTRVAGFRTEEHMRARLQRTVGHGLLCAHNRSIYTEMANEWMEDARVYLRRSKGEGLFTIDFDGEGNILGARLSDDIKAISKADAVRLNFLRKMGRFMDYIDILRAELTEVEVEKLEKRHNKIMKLRQPSAFGEYSRVILGTVRQALVAGTPPWALALSSEPDIDPAIVPFYVPDYRAELFIFLSMKQEVADVDDITTSVLISRAKEAPYRYALDIPGFMYYRNTTEGRAKLNAITFGEAQNYVVAMTVFYSMFNGVIESMAAKYDWANAILEAYNLVTLDMPRIYSVANTAFWHLKGRSSTGISALQPRDPYLAIKQASRVAAFLVRHLVPNRNIPRSWQEGIATMLDRGARFLAFGPAKKLIMDQASTSTRLTEWMSVAEIFVDSLATDKPYQVLQSATGTGKSREFIAALDRVLRRRGAGKRIWLAVPRNILKDGYSNPDVPASEIVKVSKETVIMGQRLVISTYGALLARMNTLNPAEFVLACDEFHEATPEQVAIEFETRLFDRIFISATPRLELFPSLTKVLMSPVLAKFKVEYVPMNGGVMDMFQEMRRLHPEKAERALFIVPTLRKANRIQMELQASGLPTSVLSRYTPVPASNGIIVATQVVDAGITITPPPQVVICDREAIISDRGLTRSAVTSASTLAQRGGRTGRLSNGLCYHHVDAGTGPDPKPYPAWGMYTSKPLLMAHFTKLHQITTVITKTGGDSYTVTDNADPTRISTRVVNTVEESDRTRLLNSLRAYYLIVAWVEAHDMAKNVYMKIMNENLFLEAIAPAEAGLKALLLREVWFPYDELVSRLDSNPYQSVINGRKYDHCGLKLAMNDIVLLGTPSSPKEFWR